MADSSAVGKGKYGIPPIAPMDPNTGNPVPYAGNAVADAEASKAKVSIKLPEITASAYANFCVSFPNPDGTVTETCCLDPTSKATCVKIDAPKSDYDSSGGVTWNQITGPVWVNTPKRLWKTRPRFGTFPDVQVSTLAFGSIPVTATVHLDQVVGKDGYYTPLQLFYGVSSEFPIGTKVDGYGISPPSPFEPTRGSNVYFPATLNGSVNVRLSDITIDRQPVEVGPRCSTATPARLTLGSPGGFAGATGETTTPVDYYGRPGSFTTNPKAQLYGNLDIPRFSGCKNGREDLDPLLTGIVSAARNPVTITLTTTLDVCNFEGCPEIPTADPPAGQATTAAIAAVLSNQQQQQRIARAVLNLAPREQATALLALPAAFRGQISRRLERLR